MPANLINEPPSAWRMPGDRRRRPLARNPAVRARLLAALLAAGLAALPAWRPAQAQAWPSKPVRIIVPFPAGGLSDVFARGLAQELTTVWGQQVIVENRPGANTIIGAEATAKSAPDGYTMLLANDPTMSANQYLYSKLPYDPVRDLAPVINIIAVSSVLVANPAFPASSLPELVALARKNPGKFTYGTFGPGSKTHIDTEAFAGIAGIQLNHVPYKGIAEVLPAVMGGQVDMALSGLSPCLPLIRNGKLKAIAMASPRRAPTLPDVPTFEEGGIHDFESRAWFGLVIPAATPRPLIDRIAADIQKVVTVRSFADKYIEGVGLESWVLMPDQFADMLKRDRETYAERIRHIGVKLD